MRISEKEWMNICGKIARYMEGGKNVKKESICEKFGCVTQGLERTCEEEEIIGGGESRYLGK